MESETLQREEAMCAEGRTAPRVKLDDIQSAIDIVHYRTGAECVGYTNSASLKVMTLAIAVMRNGFVIIGKAAPAAPENFSAELGKKLAYEDAVRQIWPLMGFELRQRLYEETLRDNSDT